MNSFLDDTEYYKSLITEEMKSIIGYSSEGLFSWMRYHLGWEDDKGFPIESSPGKMIRSTGLLLAAKLSGGDIEKALPAAAAIELIHNFSLLHDDIEDQSVSRRNRPTLWTVVDQAQAINTGDGMFILGRNALLRLERHGISIQNILEATKRLDEACISLVRGQYLDITFETRDDVSTDEYIQMALGKTAAMFAAPLSIGAVIADANSPTIDSLHRAGLHIGISFQMIDDVLGIWGDPTITGKPVGDDIRSKKMTYPVIMAFEAGDENLVSIYKKEQFSDDDIEYISTLIEKTGAKELTELRAKEENLLALKELEDIGLERNMLEQFQSFAEAAVGRTT